LQARKLDYHLKLNEVHTKPEDKVKTLLDYLQLEGKFELANDGELTLSLKEERGAGI